MGTKNEYQSSEDQIKSKRKQGKLGRVFYGNDSFLVELQSKTRSIKPKYPYSRWIAEIGAFTDAPNLQCTKTSTKQDTAGEKTTNQLTVMDHIRQVTECEIFPKKEQEPITVRPAIFIIHQRQRKQ